MPVVSSDIEVWGSEGEPVNDAQSSGGNIQHDAHATGGIIVTFTDIAALDNVEILSDGADTRVLTLTGRLSTGAIAVENLNLNGTNVVTSANQYERILRAVVNVKDAARTVTVRRATGDTLIGTIGINCKAFHRRFYDAASDPSSQKIRYELVYLRNKHATLALSNARVKLTSDPALKVRIGVATAKGNVAAVANRLAAPGGVSFVDDNVEAAVPTGILGPGEYIGVWCELTLAAGDSPFKNTFTVQALGSTA